MLNITIYKDKTTVENTENQLLWQLNTVEFFGDIYGALEKDFENTTPGEVGKRIRNHICQKLAGSPDDDAVTVFGCSEYGVSLLDLMEFIDSRDVINLTLKEIEDMRIQHRMDTAYLPVGIGDEEGMKFRNLKTVTHIVIASLYYYAYNEYKLVRCKHCGKWFATKNLKEQYCKRISPCFGTIIKGKTPLSCESAVRNITQKLRRRHDNIRNYLYINAKYDEEIHAFLTESSSHKAIVKQYPTPQNFQEYEAFLDRYPKRIKKEDIE